MWSYITVSRDEFEARKDYVESILIELGCEVVKEQMPHISSTTTIFNDVSEPWVSNRPVFCAETGFYRVDEVLFSDKPFIVLEWAETWEEVQNNCMEDVDPFPYDLSDHEIEFEVRRIIE